MRNLFKVALVAVGLMFTGSIANAQTKIGYINMEEVAQLMPESKTIQTTLATVQKDWSDTFQKLNEDYQKKAKEYQDGEKTLSDAAKASKMAELQELQKRGSELEGKAREAVEAKQAELVKPLIDKVRNAVTAVAKEKGYSYVVNSASTELLVAPDADNLLAAVKLKLGLK